MITFLRRSAKGLVPAAIVAAVLGASYFAPARLPALNFAVACSYGAGGAPTVTGINPASGPLAGGTSVTITGCGFTGATFVHFGSSSVVPTVNSDSQVTATSPAHAAGVVDVTVTTPSGTSATVAADQFTYTNACSSTNLTPDKASPQPAGTTVTFTATATNCPNPEFRFWVQAPGGGWMIARDYGAATFAWNTFGLAAGSYNIDVWARQTGSSAAYEAFHLIAYSLTAPGACASATLTPDKASAQMQGTVVTFTATSSTCPNPEYRFWLQAPGGGWMIVQDYSSTATYAWNTDGMAAGTYNVDVWARQKGSAAAEQTFALVSYTLTARQACTAAGITPDKASPQQTGTIVTFTGTSATCSQPLYRFWVQAPGGGWVIARDYSTTATFAWNTAGRAAGTYNIDVWVLQNGTPGPTVEDTFKVISYTLGAAVACTTGNMTPDKASPQAHGTTVTFTATSAGCSQPVYRFWVQPPGGGWAINQDYSTTSTFAWNTTGLAAGTYHIDVWVKQNGSSAAEETFFVVTYTLT